MKDDMISRQAAINAICEDGTRLERQGRYSMTMVERKQRDVDILENLSSVQPECEDAVPRTSIEYICRKNTVSTNPYEHKYHDKFIQFMDDPEISDFGRWQHSNGFNTALVAVKCDLDKVPTVTPKEEPEIIRCRECKYYDGRPCGIVDWYNTENDFCSRAERRTDE